MRPASISARRNECSEKRELRVEKCWADPPDFEGRRQFWRKLLAFAGIAVIVSGRTGTDVTPVVLLALLMIPFALAEGTVIIKIFRPGNPMVTNAIGMTVCAQGRPHLFTRQAERHALVSGARHVRSGEIR